MSRSPSIHITKDKLESLLNEYFSGNKIQDVQPGFFTDRLADYLLLNGKEFNLSNRSILQSTNEKTRKAIIQHESSARADASLFATLLKTIRTHELKHRGIILIRPGTKEWGLLKQVTANADTFCEAYQLQLRAGYISYIQTFFKATNTGGFKTLGVMSAKHDQICATYEAIRDIEEDTDSNSTREMHELYSAEVSSKTGIPIDYSKEPGKYVYFVYARQLAKKYGLTMGQYIKAQFGALDWANGIPTPNQLCASYAEERTLRWMAKYRVKKHSPIMVPQQDDSFWARIKSYEDNLE